MLRELPADLIESKFRPKGIEICRNLLFTKTGRLEILTPTNGYP